MEKMRIGVFFGGNSREREVSFAGGRTVYDNLNKSIFEPIPVFVDSFGNFVLLTWEYIYKGSIRDFYPPADALPSSVHEFQVYAESLGELDRQEQGKLINKMGSRIEPSALSSMMARSLIVDAEAKMALEVEWQNKLASGKNIAETFGLGDA